MNLFAGATPMEKQPMSRSYDHPRSRRHGERGQVIVVVALAMVALVGGVALVLEGGNAYSQQRAVQNGADAASNAGAVVLAQRLGGAAKTDSDVNTAVTAVANANLLTTHTAFYTNALGQYLDASGNVVATQAQAVAVGSGAIPNNARGVAAGGSRPFDTFFGRIFGFTQFTASAEATSITGPLEGGPFLPVVFPINIVDCQQNGDLGVGEANWTLADQGANPGDVPVGTEYIVPLCKTGGGSFMILDLDGQKNNCQDEVINPPQIQLDLPTDIASDNGNNCAKQMVDAVNARRTQVFLVPICDVDCVTGGGSNATYHIVKVAAFWVDYMSDTNNPNNSLCQAGTSPNTGQAVIPIRGNGSSSCIAGFFVRYYTQGPVGTGNIGNSDAIGVQLIK